MTAALTGYLMSASEQPTADLQDRARVGAVPARGRRPAHRLAAAGGGRCGTTPRSRRKRVDEGRRPSIGGKIATAAFFASHMLPGVSALRGIVEHVDDDVMALPDSAF